MKIKFVKDRPGHDFNYALNSKKIRKKFLNGNPKKNLSRGIKETFDWYYENYNFFKYIFKKKIF